MKIKINYHKIYSMVINLFFLASTELTHRRVNDNNKSHASDSNGTLNRGFVKSQPPSPNNSSERNDVLIDMSRAFPDMVNPTMPHTKKYVIKPEFSAKCDLCTQCGMVISGGTGY